MQKLPISLVVITKNEENNIRRCIESVDFASEVIVLDSHSTDKTRDIAQSLGALVHDEDWRGYGPQKHRATELASHDWILNLDADEALSIELQNEIKAKFSQLQPEIGYELPRLSWHLGRWIRHGGWHPDRQLRLYNRKKLQWPLTQVHEKIDANETRAFEKNMLHWVFDDFADQVKTNNHYSSLQASELFKNQKRFSLFKLLVKPPTKFLELYFFKLGILDGLPGFLIAVSASYSTFSKWAKLWELETKENQ